MANDNCSKGPDPPEAKVGGGFWAFSPFEIKYDFIYNIYMSENELFIDILAASILGSNFLVSNYLVSFLSNQPVRWEI